MHLPGVTVDRVASRWCTPPWHIFQSIVCIAYVCPCSHVLTVIELRVGFFVVFLCVVCRYNTSGAGLAPFDSVLTFMTDWIWAPNCNGTAPHVSLGRVVFRDGCSATSHLIVDIIEVVSIYCFVSMSCRVCTLSIPRRNSSRPNPVQTHFVEYHQGPNTLQCASKAQRCGCSLEHQHIDTDCHRRHGQQ